MKNTCALVFFLFGMQCSVKVAGQATQTITPKVVSLKVVPTEALITGNSGASHNISCRHSYTNRDRRIPEPLYVIDGKLAGGEDLKRISPSDIEKIEVVKGIQAVALYGQKGNNGVIVIMTKGHRSK